MFPTKFCRNDGMESDESVYAQSLGSRSDRDSTALLSSDEIEEESSQIYKEAKIKGEHNWIF